MFSASATGQRNLDQGTAGQDASHYRVTGDMLVAVVCDGAGSVRQGGAGANFIARSLTEQLSSTLREDRHRLDRQAEGSGGLATLLREAVQTVRERLAELAASREQALDDYACTLVGCVASAAGGCLFHIGDGFAIVQDSAGDTALSRPENGEYADETYFVTDEKWKDHLRLTPVGAPGRGCVIGLMSDGTAPFAVDRARSGFFRPFLDPIAAYLREAAGPSGDEALRNLLQSPKASEISSDDKTLLLAFVAER